MVVECVFMASFEFDINLLYESVIYVSLAVYMCDHVAMFVEAWAAICM